MKITEIGKGIDWQTKHIEDSLRSIQGNVEQLNKQINTLKELLQQQSDELKDTKDQMRARVDREAFVSLGILPYAVLLRLKDEDLWGDDMCSRLIKRGTNPEFCFVFHMFVASVCKYVDALEKHLNVDVSDELKQFGTKYIN